MENGTLGQVVARRRGRVEVSQGQPGLISVDCLLISSLVMAIETERRPKSRVQRPLDTTTPATVQTER